MNQDTPITKPCKDDELNVVRLPKTVEHFSFEDFIVSTFPDNPNIGMSDGIFNDLAFSSLLRIRKTPEQIIYVVQLTERTSLHLLTILLTSMDLVQVAKMNNTF